MSIFFQETESAVKVKKTTTVEPSAYAKVGATLDVELGTDTAKISAGVDAKLGAAFPQTSEWVDLPGGYTAYMTIYERENPNYDYIYHKFAFG